jgi:uncharacterized protein with PQ loop repeat
MGLADILGWVATALFSICYLPQIIKLGKTKRVDGLSIIFLVISLIANIIALGYATLIKQPPLQIKYILSMSFLSICIFTYLRIVLNNRRQIK